MSKKTFHLEASDFNSPNTYDWRNPNSAVGEKMGLGPQRVSRQVSNNHITKSKKLPWFYGGPKGPRHFIVLGISIHYGEGIPPIKQRAAEVASLIAEHFLLEIPWQGLTTRATPCFLLQVTQSHYFSEYWIIVQTWAHTWLSLDWKGKWRHTHAFGIDISSKPIRISEGELTWEKPQSGPAGNVLLKGRWANCYQRKLKK